ncbi:MAG: hypothetical protein VW450_03570 [Chloroflexota bacterium]
MRPGLVVIGLIALLLVIYLLTADALGRPLIYLLQGAIVGAVLAAALWARRAKGRRSILGDPADDDGADDQHHLPRAS